MHSYGGGKASTGLISRETNSHRYHVCVGKLKIRMAQIDVRAISDILPALEQQHMTWGGEGARGEIASQAPGTRRRC